MGASWLTRPATIAARMVGAGVNTTTFLWDDHAAGDYPPNGPARFWLCPERFSLHQLKDLKSLRLLSGILRNGFVNIGWHGISADVVEFNRSGLMGMPTRKVIGKIEPIFRAALHFRLGQQTSVKSLAYR